MNTYTIIGIKPVDFESNGKQIKGVSLYLGRHVKDGFGYRQYTKAWIKGGNADNYVLYSEVTPIYNQYGDIVGVR